MNSRREHQVYDHETPGRDNDSRAQEIRAAMARVDYIAQLTDTRFGVPGTPFRFGLDGIVGLIPVVGDLVGLVLSSWLFSEAWRIGAPMYVKRRMLTNMGIDFAVGLVPVVGDLLDVAYKANVRNRNLLREWLDGELKKIDDPEDENVIAGAVGLLAFTGASVLLVGWVSGSVAL